MPTSIDQSKLEAYVATELKSESNWTKLWSAVHHTFIFGAAILSALAALTLQLKSLTLQPDTRTDVATGLAALAALIGVISASGGFGKKWRANRITKGTLEQIQIELMDPSCDLSKIISELKEMKRIHHLAIVGEDDPRGGKSPNVPAPVPAQPSSSLSQ